MNEEATHPDINWRRVRRIGYIVVAVIVAIPVIAFGITYAAVHVPDPKVVAQAWEVWRAEVAFAERYVAEAPNLDVVGNTPDQGPVSLREVLVHMIEEYARHNGHADLLRERIDGRVGQ